MQKVVWVGWTEPFVHLYVDPAAVLTGARLKNR